MKRLVYSNLFKPFTGKAALIFCACLLATFASPELRAAVSFPPEIVVNTAQGQAFEGEWIADFKARNDGKVEFTLRYEERKADSSGGWNYNNWSNSNGIAPEQLQGLTREQATSATGGQVKFQLKRDAGTFDCDGWFKDGRGAGLFAFLPNRGFIAEINRRGINGSLTDEQLFQLAHTDMGLAFLDELKSQNYEMPTLDQLLRMSEHGVRLDFLKGLKALGAKPKTVESLLDMRDNGVSLSFIEQLRAYGFQNLSADDLIKSRQAGVSATYLSALKQEGYSGLSMDELVRLRSQGVSAPFIQGLREEGYPKMSLDQLVRIREQGVSVSYIKELKELGYAGLPVEQLVRLRASGVTASFIRRVKANRGNNPTIEELIQMRNSGSYR
ncbi:MAG TPA: hypothetical protein VF779_15400 [Pyrinomonadaceae bacterium]